eukprot:1158468-Pelagomonas_calceolata.AAC.1
MVGTVSKVVKTTKLQGAAHEHFKKPARSNNIPKHMPDAWGNESTVLGFPFIFAQEGEAHLEAAVLGLQLTNYLGTNFVGRNTALHT